MLLSLARRPSTRTLLLAPEILIGTDDDDARLDGQERDATTSRELLHGGAAADERFEGEHWLTYDLNEPTDDESSEEEESTSTATTDDDDNHEGRTASSPLTPPPPPPAPYHPYRYWGTDPGSPSTSASARLASKQQARLEREAYGALVQRQYWRHRRRRRQTSEPPAPADQEDGEQEREEMDLSEQELVREVLMALRSPAICRLASSHDDESSVIFRRLDQSKQHSDGESGDQEQEQIAVRLRRDFRLAHLSPLALHATLQPFARALELILTLERDLATLLRASPPESRARQRAGQRGHVLHSEEEAAAAAAAAVHAFVSAVREALQHAQARIARLELALVGGGVASCGGSSSSSSNNTPPTVISILALKRDVVDVLVRTLGPLARVACACVESRRQRASLENGHGESDETVLLDALVREISEQEAGQPPSLEDGDARGELGAREPEAPAPSQVAAAAPARVLRLVLSRTAEPAWRDLGVWLARGQLIRARANVFWISLGAAGEQQHSDALDDDDDDDEEPFVVECRVPEMFAHVAQKACEAGAQQTLLRSLDLPESELARSGDVATWPSITQVVLGSSSTPSLDLFASAPLVAATHGERVDSDAGLPFELMLRRAISRSCAPYISASSRALHAALMRSCDFSPLVHAWHDLMLVRAASGSFLDALLDATDKNARYWADSHALAALASAHRLHRTRIHVPRIRGGARHGGGGGGGGGDKNNNADNDDAVDRALARIEVQHELVYPIGRVLPVSHGEVLQDAWRLMARTQLARRRVDRLATRHTDPSLLSREAHALRFKLSHALAAVGFVWDAVAASQLALFRARLESTQSVAQVRAAHEQLMDALARQMFLTDDVRVHTLCPGQLSLG